MTTYADATDLTARLSSSYTVPADPDAMLIKASELIDYVTFGRAEIAWAAGDTATMALITQATCDQVEYWLETGEEHDVLGLHGSLMGGRVQVQNLPPTLGQRALRTLLRAGLYWSGAAAF